MKITIKEFKSKLDQFEIYNIFRAEKNTVILDSSKEDRELSKYSFIGINPYLNFKAKSHKCIINEEEVVGDPFNILDNLLNKYKVEHHTIDIPFIAGAIGYISYDACRIVEELPSTAKEDFVIPDMQFTFYNNIIVFDHLNDKKYITAIENEHTENSIENILKRIECGRQLTKKEVATDITNKFISNFTKETYKDAVKKIKNYIVSGDVYIANMTQRYICETEKSSIDIYQELREINKAPFAAFMNYEDFQIICSSPERFIQIKDRVANTRPIKGTRPRGNSREEDSDFRQQLVNSEKDKSELLMVVDLERNDFSKVCKPHTVKVTDLFKIEEYATVFHLVSAIEGVLKEEVTTVKALRECFPGGSITGTPKIRTMEIIEELEKVKRGIYTGSIGYFDFRGNADFNIVIRTIIKKENKAYFGVGGGITIESNEEEEYIETLDKAKALMRVLS